MRKSRFTEAQIVGILKKQQGGQATKDACRRHGIGGGRSTSGRSNSAAWK